MSENGKALVRATAAYGGAPPDWIAALANACDARNQSAVAVTLDYSRTVVNLVLHGKYDRDSTEIERAVRERLMGEKVICPILGQILATVCGDNQALPYSNANHDRVALYRACRRGCPNSSIKHGKRR